MRFASTVLLNIGSTQTRDFNGFWKMTMTEDAGAPGGPQYGTRFFPGIEPRCLRTTTRDRGSAPPSLRQDHPAPQTFLPADRLEGIGQW